MVIDLSLTESPLARSITRAVRGMYFDRNGSFGSATTRAACFAARDSKQVLSAGAGSSAGGSEHLLKSCAILGGGDTGARACTELDSSRFAGETSCDATEPLVRRKNCVRGRSGGDRLGARGSTRCGGTSASRRGASRRGDGGIHSTVGVEGRAGLSRLGLRGGDGDLGAASGGSGWSETTPGRSRMRGTRGGGGGGGDAVPNHSRGSASRELASASARPLCNPSARRRRRRGGPR